MRCLIRNKRDFYFARFTEQVEIKDEWGNATGQYQVIYGSPVLMKANVSASQGEIQSRQFGESESYDKVIVLDDVNTPIDEYSILWVDSPPRLNADGTLSLNEDGGVATPHDYIVKKVARGLNTVSIAISKVTVR